MSLTITNGYQTLGNRIFAGTSVSWTSLATSPYASWSNWTHWNPEPNTLTVKVFKDAGEIGSRLPLLPLSYRGDITVSLKISNTVDSSLNLISPTTVNLTPGVEYSVVEGRYYEYTLTLVQDSETPVPFLVVPEIEFDDARTQEFIEQVDTSTLTGTIDARVISTNIGTITAMTAVAVQGGTTYSSQLLQDRVYAIPDDYVFQENAIIVNIVSRANSTIRCFDLNGESIDAVIDVWVQGLGKIILTPDGVVKNG